MEIEDMCLSILTVISTIVSAVSAAVAANASCKATRYAREQWELSYRSENAANIFVSCGEKLKDNRRKVYFTNGGKGVADNLKVRFEGAKLQLSNDDLDYEDQSCEPRIEIEIGTLSPNETHAVEVVVQDFSGKASLTWKDGFSENNRKEITLNFMES